MMKQIDENYADNITLPDALITVRIYMPYHGKTAVILYFWRIIIVATPQKFKLITVAKFVTSISMEFSLYTI